MPSATQNPFIHGRHVPPDSFVGRETTVKRIFGKIRTGHSVLLVGEPKIGKTSILQYMADAKVIKKHLSDTNLRYLFCHANGHLLPTTMSPRQFWDQILTKIRDLLAGASPSTLIHNYLKKKTYDALQILDLFVNLAEKNFRVVILFDELDSIFFNPNIGSRDFLAPLRALCTGTGGLLIVATARIGITALTDLVEKNGDLGSPLLNYFTEEHITPFSADEVKRLFDSYLAFGAIRFSTQELTFVQQLTGGLPYLVQLAGYEMFDRRISGQRLSNEHVKERLDEVVAPYFEVLWRALDDLTQRLVRFMVRQSLAVLPRLGSKLPRLETPQQFVNHCIRQLARIGLLRPEEPAGAGALPSDAKISWQLSAELFVRWVASHKLAAEESPELPEPLDSPAAPAEIFVSYAHADDRLLDEFLVHLKPIERRGLVAKWSERDLSPGANRGQALKAALLSSKVVLMLLSPEYLGSSSIYKQQIEPTLQRAASGGARILWVLLRACTYQATALKDYQAAFPPTRPLAQMSRPERDAAWVAICGTIAAALAR